MVLVVEEAIMSEQASDNVVNATVTDRIRKVRAQLEEQKLRPAVAKAESEATRWPDWNDWNNWTNW
jgi:hypothetical protein